MFMAKKIYYILKVKGKAKIPDYIQVRDAAFTLIGYFRPGRSEKFERNEEKFSDFKKIEALAEDIPFGKITQLEIE